MQVIDPTRTIPWSLYRQVDQTRRRLGSVLDGMGFGPVETPFRVAFEGLGVRLRAYDEVDAACPIMLIVPAPIKRAYIWDLSPAVSVVRRCLQSGLQVYMIEWMQPDEELRTLGLADYADRLIRDCVQVIRSETGQAQVTVAGHSLGGIFAAIFAALYPELVQRLILVGTPLHFSPVAGALGAFVARVPPAQVVTQALGNVPGSLLNSASVAASPATFVWARRLDWLLSISDPQTLPTRMRVERWTLDEMPLAQRLFEDVVEWLFREDRLMRGTLTVGDRQVTPAMLQTPLLGVVEAHGNIAPPQSYIPFHDAVQSTEKRLLAYRGDTGVLLQHVGLLVGRNAHREIWPQILRWVQGERTALPWNEAQRV